MGYVDAVPEDARVELSASTGEDFNDETGRVRRQVSVVQRQGGEDVHESQVVARVEQQPRRARGLPLGHLRFVLVDPLVDDLVRVHQYPVGAQDRRSFQVGSGGASVGLASQIFVQIVDHLFR